MVALAIKLSWQFTLHVAGAATGASVVELVPPQLIIVNKTAARIPNSAMVLLFITTSIRLKVARVALCNRIVSILHQFEAVCQLKFFEINIIFFLIINDMDT